MPVHLLSLQMAGPDRSRRSAADPLLDRCRAGDAASWRELHATAYPVAIAFLRKLGLRDPDVEDACQEVFVQILRYLPRFEGRSDFKTWLYRLCITQANRHRRRRRLTETLFFWLRDESRAREGTAGHDLTDAEARRRIAAALDRMKPLHREAFVLYELEGLSGQEVARIAGCPAATVFRRLHDARKEFTALVEAPAGRTP